MMALAVALRNTTERYVAAEAVVIEGERANYAGPSLLGSDLQNELKI